MTGVWVVVPVLWAIACSLAVFAADSPKEVKNVLASFLFVSALIVAARYLP